MKNITILKKRKIIHLLFQCVIKKSSQIGFVVCLLLISQSGYSQNNWHIDYNFGCNDNGTADPTDDKVTLFVGFVDLNSTSPKVNIYINGTIVNLQGYDFNPGRVGLHNFTTVPANTVFTLKIEEVSNPANFKEYTLGPFASPCSSTCKLASQLGAVVCDDNGTLTPDDDKLGQIVTINKGASTAATGDLVNLIGYGATLLTTTVNIGVKDTVWFDSGSNAITGTNYNIKASLASNPDCFVLESRIYANGGCSGCKDQLSGYKVAGTSIGGGVYNPKVITSCYVNGIPVVGSTSGSADAMVLTDFQLGTKTPLLNAAQVGSIWGIAYNSKNDKTYMSTVVRRHAGLGPAGLGAIYVLNNSSLGSGASLSGTVYQVPNVGTLTNAARNLPSGKTEPNNDVPAWDAVATQGIGDIDINQSTNTLYAVNLNDKKIYQVNLNSADTNLTAMINQYPATTCPNGTFRPWALKTTDTKLFVGGVCDANTEPNSPVDGWSSSVNLTAWVYEYTISTNTWATVMSGEPLNYVKGKPDDSYPLNGNGAQWQNWQTLSEHVASNTNYKEPTPILSDIEFDGAGNMVVGFIDRTAIQMGPSYVPIDGSTKEEFYTAGGDILRATYNVGSNTYDLEFPTYYSQEFYEDDFIPGGTGHPETSIGGLAVGLNGNEVLVSSMDPAQFNSGGISRYYTSTGNKNDAITLYQGSLNQGSFNKAVGIGDIEIINAPCVPVTVAVKCSEPISVDSTLTNVVWYNSANQVIGNGTSLVLSNLTPGFEDGVDTLHYTATTANPACPINSYCPLIVNVLSITSIGKDTATCTNGVANANASVFVRGIVGMTKYAYRTNATDSLWAVNAMASTADSIRIANIANPSVATTYTFRIWSSDTTCFKDTTVVLPPSVCPQPCSITGTFTQNACNNNGTMATGTDDYFTITVSAVSAMNGGASGKYEVILNGTVLNTGGTAYGTSVTVGTITTFKSDGATTYQVTIRDLSIPSCETLVFTTAVSASCSTPNCPPQICVPVAFTRTN